ncbi:MAG TPA: hypothetical protein VLD59_01130 [Steroidobacteraceae bacterium]|nr:hypothetical protein [Steroidobacteraceae bacterium]
MKLTGATLVNAAVVASGFVLTASLVVGNEREGRNGAEFRPGQQASVNSPLIDLDLARLNRQSAVESDDGLFLVRAPQVPPPPAIPAQAVIQVPPVPPKPVAPPLPFKYLGLMVDRGQLIVFVGRGDDLLSLRQGDVIANQYRVDEAGETSITFTFLPLDERQVLTIGSRQ